MLHRENSTVYTDVDLGRYIRKVDKVSKPEVVFYDRTKPEPEDHESHGATLRVGPLGRRVTAKPTKLKRGSTKKKAHQYRVDTASGYRD